MTYLIRIFTIVLLTSCLLACQNIKDDEDDDEDDDKQSTSSELVQAQSAFQSGEYQRAVRLLLPLAQKGNPDAQYALGYAMYEGLGTPEDKMQAYFWIQQSAIQGNSTALRALELFEIDPDLPMNSDVSIQAKTMEVEERVY